jgi:Zinc dependent phospholipase C
MPKEVTHWLIAQRAADHLKSQPYLISSKTRQSLAAYPAMVLLGATFHDALYYALYREASHNKHCDAVADRLHGSQGEDTFEIVRAFVACIRQRSSLESDDDDDDALRAFLLGVVTHYAADVVFHPYIYFASGNWHGKGLLAAQANHRALESALDLAFCQTHGSTVHAFSLHQFLKESSLELQDVLQRLGQASYFDGNDDATKGVLHGYRTLAYIRRFATHALVNTVFDVVEPHLSPTLRAYTALRTTPHSCFGVPDVTAKLHYRHPITGEECESTLEEMFDAAVEESVRMWGLVETAIEGGVLREKGKSLEVGLEGVPAVQMGFFR